MIDPHEVRIITTDLHHAEEAQRQAYRRQEADRRCEVGRPRMILPSPIPRTVYWKRHNTKATSRGQIVGVRPDSALIRGDEGVILISERIGTFLAGVSKEKALALSSKVWRTGLSLAQQPSIRDEFKRTGQPMPYGL
jgi:hypothetical protein